MCVHVVLIIRWLRAVMIYRETERLEVTVYCCSDPEKHCQQEVLFAHTDTQMKMCVVWVTSVKTRVKKTFSIRFVSLTLEWHAGWKRCKASVHKCVWVCVTLLIVYLCYMNIISLVKRQKTAEVVPLTFTTFSNIINSGWGVIPMFTCVADVVRA